MIYVRLLWCLCLVSIVGSFYGGMATAAVNQKKIVCLGDSLTAGLGVSLEESYPAQLEQALKNKGYDVQVINAGVSGETSRGTLSRLDWILMQKPDIVILEIGANDGLRGIDVSFVEDNLRKILIRLQESGAEVVFAGMQMVWNLGEDYTRAFNQVYPRLAEEMSLLFMPFFLQDVATVAELNNSDGIHPNTKGYAVITRNILPYVVEALERRK